MYIVVPSKLERRWRRRRRIGKAHRKGMGHQGRSAGKRGSWWPEHCNRQEDSMTRDEQAAQAQRVLWPLVGRLQEIEDALDSLLETMPDAPEEMLCTHAPADFLLEVEGGIYFLLNDDLRAVIAGLKRFDRKSVE